MGKRRRDMLKKKKYDDDAHNRQTIKPYDKPWSDLNHDLLLLVMMQLGVIDFLAFGGVCKSWRSLSISNWNKFMISKPPMSMTICISTNANEKECCLKDFEGRKFKTTLPHSVNRRCIEVTSGYLILFGEKTSDFWLVNPITRHELHFPPVPFEYCFVKAIIVFSPLIHEWVFVVLLDRYTCSFDIWFCIAGKREWTYVSTPFRIRDLHAFKGKIYVLHYDYGYHLSEVRLYPIPKVALLEIKNFPDPDFYNPVIQSWGENFYVMDRFFTPPFNIQEIYFSKMECVSQEETGEEFASFSSTSIVGAKLWADGSGKGRVLYASMRYPFHDCLNANLLHE